jgi:hypothetical protein
MQMVRKLSSVHRWCVTGTPMGDNALGDLHGALSVLCHEPFQDPRLWRYAFQVQKCFDLFLTAF